MSHDASSEEPNDAAFTLYHAVTVSFVLLLTAPAPSGQRAMEW